MGAILPDTTPRYVLGLTPKIDYFNPNLLQNYLPFKDNIIDTSILPPRVVNGKKINFVLHHHKPAIYIENNFIDSLTELVQKVQMPQELNPKLLKTIAIIINFLSHGNEYIYEEGSAKRNQFGVQFRVLKDGKHWKVKLSSLNGDGVVYYKALEEV